MVFECQLQSVLGSDRVIGQLRLASGERRGAGEHIGGTPALKHPSGVNRKSTSRTGTIGFESDVDGGRWLTLEGQAGITSDPGRVSEAVGRYAERYREPKERIDRVVIEIAVDRILGRG